MTFEQNSALPKRFVTCYLPWLIGLGALLLYLATMSRGATFSSINLVAKTSGWVWQPDLHQPLAFLLFYPFRWLPEQTVPIALNFFNAVIASLVLVLVARAVALLPHDRSELSGAADLAAGTAAADDEHEAGAVAPVVG